MQHTLEKGRRRRRMHIDICGKARRKEVTRKMKTWVGG
jgi:hypothetical protein